MRRAISQNIIVFIAALMGFSQPLAAADIELLEGDDGVDVILIEGDIKSGDDDKFNALALRTDGAVVVLSSSGGMLIPALEIGKTIQIKGFSTYVPDDLLCTSSCALIWLAGTERALSASAKVGFHASYRDNNGRLEEVGVANAIVGRYLTLLNLPERAVIFATSASPEEIRWLSPDGAEGSGIDFKIVNLSDESLSSDPPPIRTAPTFPLASSGASDYAKRVAWYYSGQSSGGSLIFVRAEDLALGHSANSRAKVWIKTDSSADSSVPFRSTMILYTVNCPAKTYVMNTGVAYYSDGRSEDILGSSKVEYVVPGSVFEGAVTLVCNDNFPAPDSRDQLRQ